ncbi:hypothetical protein IT415_00805 [bacterium]|nr:hypothetical protein [bacterium]
MRVKQSLLTRVQERYNDLQFEASDDFLYDAADEIIYYDSDTVGENEGQIALLHEIAHAQLGHFHYNTDLELFALETQAWGLTSQLCKQYSVTIPDEYLRSCLQTYASWLTQRATCPACNNFSTQDDAITYRCFLCDTRWQVKTDVQARVRRIRL